MSKTIKELGITWNNNKAGFQTQELGKLQDFITDIFESRDLFALTYGDLRKDQKKRKKEFTRETTKEGAGSRRADMVIFIDGEEIVIPVEVERLGNIRAGEHQILQYQTDWRKKYGILTDGNEWRLYFDRWFDTFYLKDIFDKKSKFWSKWEQYITPDTYYDMAFNAKGQQELFETDRLDPCTSENRPFFFNDITTLLSTFKTKISALVPLFANEERQAVETTYSYVIQFILYKVLIDNNYIKLKNDYETFRQWVKIALQTETYDEIIKDIKKIAEYIYKNIYEPFRQKQEDINKRLIEQLKKSPTLNEIAPWLDIIMFIDRYNFKDIRNELFGFVYENYLKELYNDDTKGQYFTDPAVVNFMLHELGYTKETLAKTGGKNISIIDPSCGAGTFLYSATLAIKEAFDKNDKTSSNEIERLINDNIFGLDIEEFPLFLAEMNILMQLLPVVVNVEYNNVIKDKLKLFITKDSIEEFLNTPINNSDVNYATNGFFDDFDQSNIPTYMRDRRDLVEMFKSLAGDMSKRQRFDYVIGNPPYVGLNKCYKDNIPFAVAMRDKKNDGTKRLYMNNVYGVNMHSVPNKAKKGRPNPNLYAFFIALGLALLKEKGKICYIIPQTILTAGDLDVLRYHLAKYTTIEKIITFEAKLFIGRGLTQKKPVPTSSLIFVIKKEKPSASHKIKIVNYDTYTEKQSGDFEKYLNTRNKITSDILQVELFQSIENWNFIKQDGIIVDFLSEYNKRTEDISCYYQHIIASKKFKSNFYFDGGYSIDERQMQNDQADYIYPKINNDRYIMVDIRGYWQNIRSGKNKQRIKLRQGNQGYNLLDSKYKVIWSYANTKRFFFTDKPVIWARNQFNAIGSNDKKEILYLFALLNCSVNTTILLTNLKSENEKDFLIGLTSIKQYIRVPEITPETVPIKTEIIEQTEAMLDLEKPVITDYVEFPRTAMQIFDFGRVVSNNLILTAGDRTITGKIKKDKVELVKSVVTARYPKKQSLFSNNEINLSELKFLPAIDFNAQTKVKKYIDDLVFALYFNIELTNIGIENSTAIHNKVAKNEYYFLVNTEKAPNA
jgi:hypothetical protein